MGAKDRSEPPGHEVHRTGNQAIQPAAVLSHHGAAYAEPLCNGSAHCAHPRPSAHLPHRVALWGDRPHERRRQSSAARRAPRRPMLARAPVLGERPISGLARGHVPSSRCAITPGRACGLPCVEPAWRPPLPRPVDRAAEEQSFRAPWAADEHRSGTS